jgi:hypothetical protein
MGSLGCEDFYLIDLWPGYPRTDGPTPTNGFDSTQAGNRSSTPLYPPGTKFQCYQDSSVGAGGSNVANKGFYTMMYGQYLDYTSGDDISAGAVVIAACGSAKIHCAAAFTKDVSGGQDFTICGPVAITCTSLGKSEYGWVWVDGVCPNADLTELDVTGILTDGGVVGGGPLTSVVAHETTEGALLSWPGNADGTQTLMICGFAFTDDT